MRYGFQLFKKKDDMLVLMMLTNKIIEVNTIKNNKGRFE